MRAYYIQPYYDQGQHTANFLPDTYTLNQAPRLYYPAFDANGVRVALDRVTNQTAPALLIGVIVPNSGNVADGILQAGKGISPDLMRGPGFCWGRGSV